MCLAIFKPANQVVPFDYLDTAAIVNPDGAGFAVATGGSIILEKGFFDGANGIAKELEKYNQYPVAIHFRWATQGNVDKANCHPFSLGKGWAMIHNGIIQSMPVDKTYSDTFLYSERMRQRVGGNIDWPTRKRSIRKMEREIGASKLVFLNRDGTRVIVNEDDGHWSDGVWYSNGSYKESPRWAGFGSSCYSRDVAPAKSTGWNADWYPSRCDGYAPESVKHISGAWDDACDLCAMPLASGQGLAVGHDLLCDACYAELSEQAEHIGETPEEALEALWR